MKQGDVYIGRSANGVRSVYIGDLVIGIMKPKAVQIFVAGATSIGMSVFDADENRYIQESMEKIRQPDELIHRIEEKMHLYGIDQSNNPKWYMIIEEVKQELDTK